jgi:hypothetical protein
LGKADGPVEIHLPVPRTFMVPTDAAGLCGDVAIGWPITRIAFSA